MVAIYEFKCPTCKKVFEIWYPSIKNGDWTEPCPTDGTESPKIISQCSFLLKGGGWASDGYSASPAKTDE